MNPASPLVAAAVAAAVSILGTLLTIRATTSTSRNEARQTQFKEIVQKRIEFYPQLWRITIHFETNWTITKSPKTREWAQDYVNALNNFNLDGGIFFSQAVYTKFADLRATLTDAIDQTPPGAPIPPHLATTIRTIVYGTSPTDAGLSTHLKDDLGSYQAALLQRRTPH